MANFFNAVKEAMKETNGKSQGQKQDPMAELKKKQKEELEALLASRKEDKVIEKLKKDLLGLSAGGRSEIRSFLLKQLEEEQKQTQEKEEKVEQ